MTSKREELKEELYRDIYRWGWDGEKYHQGCEGQSFKSHECGGGIHLNEYLYTKGHFQKMSTKDKKYMDNKINCSNQCQVFHTNHGHTKKFRSWFVKRMISLYGDAVQEYIDNSPTIIKATFE